MQAGAVDLTPWSLCSEDGVLSHAHISWPPHEWRIIVVVCPIGIHFLTTDPTRSDPKKLTTYWKKGLCFQTSFVEEVLQKATLEMRCQKGWMSQLAEPLEVVVHDSGGSYPSSRCFWPFKGTYLPNYSKAKCLEKCTSEHTVAFYWFFWSGVGRIHSPVGVWEGARSLASHRTGLGTLLLLSTS